MNRLGRAVAAEMDAHPGQSGFYMLHGNKDALVARGMLAQVAEKTLDLQYYIFKNDESGKLVLTWIMDAAERGVRVRILLDDLGVDAKDSNLALLNSQPNIEVRVFNPFSQRSGLKADFIFDLSRVERRMHNKSFIADNSAAIIGGRNVGNEYYTVPGARTFLDLDVMAVGPVVMDISNSFDAFWNSEWAYPVEALYPTPPEEEEIEALKTTIRENTEQLKETPYRKAVEDSDLYKAIVKEEFSFTWAPSTFFYDSPDKVGAAGSEDENPMITDLRSRFRKVDTELLMVTPYFVPGENGVRYFNTLRAKNVDVKVLTNSLATNDVWVVHSGYAPYRKELLSAGVELYELKPSALQDVREELKKYIEVNELRLHIKAIVFDRRYILMGSSNFDPRAFNYNTEIGLLIDSPELAKQMADGFNMLVSPENSYKVYLVDETDKNGRVRKKVRWEALEEGELVMYKDEPEAGFWRKFGAWFMRAFPIEGKL